MAISNNDDPGTDQCIVSQCVGYQVDYMLPQKSPYVVRELRRRQERGDKSNQDAEMASEQDDVQEKNVAKKANKKRSETTQTGGDKWKEHHMELAEKRSLVNPSPFT